MSVHRFLWLGVAIMAATSLQSPIAHAGKLSNARDKTTSREDSSRDDDDDDDDDSSIWCLIFCWGDGDGTSDTSTVYVEPARPRPPPERIEYFYSKWPYFGGTSRFTVQKRWPAAEIVERSALETPRKPADSTESAVQLPEGKSIVGADAQAGLLFVADSPRVETIDAQPVILEEEELEGRQRYVATVAGDYSRILPGINRGGGLFQISSVIGAELGFDYFEESGDYLHLLQAGLFFAPVTSHGQFQFGADFLHLGGPDGFSEVGGAGMISGHWFPLKPLIVSPSLRVGLVGDAPAFYMRARLTVGAIFGPAELFAGWEHTQIADEALGGPLFGVRLWL